ncbi:MAG: hypothetical protein HOB12_15445, partial [Gemmatimonadales bacterium]|nr:hypothetical protein [Gemmatimonadales bacterium]
DIAQLRARNPLGKVPILFTDDDATLFDSQVICEYLDSLVPAPRLFPADGPARWQALTLGALADGILESALLLVYEGRYRPEDKHVQSWMDMQQDKIDTALRTLEASPPHWDDAPHYGHATLACALGYLDFRHGGHWRAAYPELRSRLGGGEVVLLKASRGVAMEGILPLFEDDFGTTDLVGVVEA